MPLFTAKCDDSVRIVDYPETNPRSSLRDFISILVVDPAMNRWAKLGRPSDFVVRAGRALHSHNFGCLTLRDFEG